ncbi:MAG: DUF1553 domain-containing protein [Gemmataceae bacterium]|nr:DUF1553 domain-containing protein [Gemmataceae bacterium]
MSSTVVAWCVFFSSASVGDIDFFEKKIRPVLVEHCYSCHSPEGKIRGGLRVDSRAALLEGGETRAAIVPGDPAKSLLLEALRSVGDLKMPPKQKLPDAVIADFERWIKQGAVDPRTPVAAKGKEKSKSPTVEEGRGFWAFQPVKRPEVPKAHWAKNDLDAFILAQLEKKKLKPAPDAEPRVLIRRLYFDLIGLPPTPEEIDAFEKAAAKNQEEAIEAVVDRLLASPRFGERMGRRWLDVARYAESLTLRGFVLKEAWRYRDYVIDTFNKDVPLDRFVREQLAGDLMSADNPADRRQQIVATGFLAMGNNNLEEQDRKQLQMDLIDEQLDTLGKAFLGQTISCARCHDHKFDPIPTRDYYALAGILQNVRTLTPEGNLNKWIEVPIPSMTGNDEEIRKHEQAIAKLQAEIDSVKALLAKATARSADPKKPRVVSADSLVGIVVDDSQAMKVGEWKHSTFSGFYVGSGYSHDDAKGQGEKTLTFQPKLPESGMYEVRFAYSPGGNRATEVEITVFSEDGETTVKVNEQQPPTIDGLFVSLGQFQFDKGGQSHVVVSNANAKGHVIADAVVYIPVEKLKAGGVAKADKKTPEAKTTEPKSATKGDTGLKSLEAAMKKLQTSGPRREVALSFHEEKKMANARIHIRGSIKNLGDEVPRGFLQVATRGAAPKIPADQSGRKQLADWMTAPENPLTARVMVNRLWLWTFGEGLVRTPDNFGVTGERPTHPALLDYLTTRFVEDGWSAKKLIRTMVLSRTYRQASANPTVATADPENRLWGRMSRRRLDAESIRDAILAVSGQLKLDTAGPSFTNVSADYNYVHKDTCRSVYIPVFRNALPDLFEAFDFADPSMTVGKRNASTVSPQALFMMNNPFVLEQSKFAAKRMLAEKRDDAERIANAYRQTLGRTPSDAERRIALEYLAEAGNQPALREEAWSRFVQTLFASIEFRFVN